MKFMPGVEDTVDLYTEDDDRHDRRLSDPDGRVLPREDAAGDRAVPVAASPYAILLIFILAAVLTPDGNPWNQAVVAAPMIGLYLVSIVLAWLVAPAPQKPDANRRRVGEAAARIRRDGHRSGAAAAVSAVAGTAQFFI